MKVRVKICCISSVDEAAMAVNQGASAVGLVGRMPSGPGPIPDELIRMIARRVPPGVSSFLLTCETTVPAIVAHHARTQTNTIQIVDSLPAGRCSEIRLLLPSVKLVRVVHVLDERSVDEALEAASEADALLLDSGNPALRVLGGTGKIHDWTLSRSIVEQSGVPVFLAGGLTPENVRGAIGAVQPFGDDLCNGVRTGGRLDERKLENFMKAVSAEA